MSEANDVTTERRSAPVRGCGDALAKQRAPVAPMERSTPIACGDNLTPGDRRALAEWVQHVRLRAARKAKRQLRGRRNYVACQLSPHACEGGARTAVFTFRSGAP